MWVLGVQYENPRAYRKRVGISKPELLSTEKNINAATMP